jgi:hypothetical protein
MSRQLSLLHGFLTFLLQPLFPYVLFFSSLFSSASDLHVVFGHVL